METNSQIQQTCVKTSSPNCAQTALQSLLQRRQYAPCMRDCDKFHLLKQETCFMLRENNAHPVMFNRRKFRQLFSTLLCAKFYKSRFRCISLKCNSARETYFPENKRWEIILYYRSDVSSTCHIAIKLKNGTQRKI